MNKNFKLAPPFQIAYEKLRVFFDGDPAFELSELEESAEGVSCTLCVYDDVKYLIAKEFLKTDYDADNGGLKVNIEKANPSKSLGELGLGAFLTTNPHFKEVIISENPDLPMNAVMFKKEVLQYPADNFFSPYGHNSVMAQDLVKEFFEEDINCHTDTHDA